MSQQINLYNPLLLKKRQVFGALMVVQILGVVLLGLVCFSGYASWQLSHQRTETAALSAQLGAAQSQLATLKATTGVRQKSQALENTVEATEHEIASLQKVFDLLKAGEFGNTRGYSAYLRAFSRQIISGLWLTGFNIQGAGNEIAIKGRTLQPAMVPAYITQLKREQVMQGASFATLEMMVPMVDAPATVPAGPPKPKLAAGYVEFNLQSSGLAKASNGAVGGKPQ